MGRPILDIAKENTARQGVAMDRRLGGQKTLGVVEIGPWSLAAAGPAGDRGDAVARHVGCLCPRRIPSSDCRRVVASPTVPDEMSDVMNV